MGRDLQGSQKLRMKAVKWVVAKLQGDKAVFFLQRNEWLRSYRVTNQHPSLPWNFTTHGFLYPSAFPDFLLLGLSLTTHTTLIKGGGGHPLN